MGSFAALQVPENGFLAAREIFCLEKIGIFADCYFRAGG
jgi:hypothetical protein